MCCETNLFLKWDFFFNRRPFLSQVPACPLPLSLSCWLSALHLHKTFRRNTFYTRHLSLNSSGAGAQSEREMPRHRGWSARWQRGPPPFLCPLLSPWSLSGKNTSRGTGAQLGPQHILEGSGIPQKSSFSAFMIRLIKNVSSLPASWLC